ncbi:LysR family transcriptional regulator [Streptomyces sp. NPDC048718]|uniref:LysR family transcriptional regulator n=1 Tax=Streptomyces sp. NPDC048718 TaxID=3365587 RepID=UPI0037108DD0
MRTFREVARQGSVTRAARNLGYAQSSITGHIKSLETKLGYPLLKRLPHGVRLTQHGEIVRDYAERIMLTMEEMSGALQPQGEAEGRVAIGADPLLMEQRLGRLIREARYRYPKVTVSPRQLSSRNAAESVARGETQLAVVAFEDGQDTLPDDLTAEKLPALTLVPVASPALAATPVTDAQRPVRVLTVNADCASHLPLVRVLRSRYGVDPAVIEAGSVGGVRELARAGYGLAMIPPDDSLAAQGLQIVPGVPHAELDVRLVYSRADHLGRADRSIAELIRRMPAPAPAECAGDAPCGVELDKLLAS